MNVLYALIITMQNEEVPFYKGLQCQNEEVIIWVKSRWPCLCRPLPFYNYSHPISTRICRCLIKYGISECSLTFGHSRVSLKAGGQAAWNVKFVLIYKTGQPYVNRLKSPAVQTACAGQDSHTLNTCRFLTDCITIALNVFTAFHAYTVSSFYGI